jgi:hypothetical protein
VVFAVFAAHPDDETLARVVVSSHVLGLTFRVLPTDTCRSATARRSRDLPEGGSRSLLVTLDDAPMRSLGSTTLTETSSDQHRVYLTRLCGTFRLFQPPGALFRS